MLIGVPVVIAVALVVALVGVNLTGAGKASADAIEPGSGSAVQAELAGIPQEANIIGDADAPVLVTEYLDLRCPVCAAWSARELPVILAAQVHPGRIRFERRIWPILGPDSERAAEGAEAAGAQGKLFAFSEVWFRNQRPETEDYANDEFLVAVAREAGLDVARFQRDLASMRSKELETASGVGANAATVKRLGLTGTPAFVVADAKGRIQVLRQYASSDELGTAIAQALAR